MVTPAKCPQCGSDLDADARICKACGHELTEAEMQPPSPPPSYTPPPSMPPEPSPVSSDEAPKAAAGTSVDVAAMLADVRNRWAIQDSPVFIAALAMLAVSFLIGTFSVISWLIAGDGEFTQQANAAVSFLFALVLALGAVGLIAFLRLEAGPLREEADRQDQMIFYALVGLSLIFTLLSLFKGLDESLDAEGAWHRYALLYAFYALGFALIARPTPSAMGGLATPMLGFGALGVAVVFGLIGLFQGRSNDFSTYSMGVSLLDAAYVLAALSLAWFLGMRKADSRM